MYVKVTVHSLYDDRSYDSVMFVRRSDLIAEICSYWYEGLREGRKECILYTSMCLIVKFSLT